MTVLVIYASLRKGAIFYLIENPPAMPVVAGDGKKALAAVNATIQKSSSVLN